ncbi:hypothetical protein BDV95DRAFT_123155 [Massariosphaeria phaeospora]|uniref:Protein kinase domain-containing protein n=1 Tax=Massariosphaeria phaeospora TaxID=100035 RepID=A0A7C8M644_9PLEO|nr:hypothetical protein BDV95DRAFT_123155 [Massariosphaeria phaeospora]
MADDPDSLPDYQDPDEELYEEFNKIFELDGEHLNNEPDGWPYDSGYVESEPVMRFALNDTFGRTLEVKSREYAPPSEDFYLGTMKRWTWRSPKLGDGKTLVKIECFEQGSDVGQEMWGSLELKMEDDGQGGNHPVYDVRIRDADVPDVPHWKHAFLETIDVYRGPGRDITIEERGKWRVFRNFSNFRAAKTFHEILTASLRLVPRAMPMPGGPGELPPAYGQAWTYSFEEGSTSYFSYQIEKPGDYCNVCASFKKTGDNSEWAQLRHDRTMWASITGPTAKETIWQLHFGPPQDPVFWFKNMEDGQTYYVTKRVEAGLPNELPDNAYVSDVFPCTGRWTRANIFKSASPPWNSNIVELYVCCDDDNTIIDRVIQKRFPYLGNKHSLEATEVPLHLELTHNAMNDCIIALRAVSRRKPIPFDARNLPPYEPSGLRMFVEYAAKGNLYALIEHYHDKKAHVPEVFIWILLRNLARACIKLETPAIGQVNQDVKPDNIFIQDCQPDRNFPGYHYPVLGDFGLCFQAGGPVNGAGTPG